MPTHTQPLPWIATRPSTTKSWTHDSGFSSSTTSAQTPSFRRNALAAVSIAIDCTGTPLPSAIEDAHLPLCTASSVACRSFRLRYNQRSTGQRSLHTPFTRKGREPGDSTLIEGIEPESTASSTLCVDCIVYPQSPPVQRHFLQPNTQSTVNMRLLRSASSAACALLLGASSVQALEIDLTSAGMPKEPSPDRRRG